VFVRSATTGIGTGHGSGLWPVLLALVIVLLPTAGVLWFLNEAVRNERLAGKQKLAEAYRSYLPTLRERLDAYWRQQAEALDAQAAKTSGPATFAACVRDGLADSVVCYDPPGRLAYPATGQGRSQAVSLLPQTTEGQGMRQAISPLPSAGEGQGVRAAGTTTDSALAEKADEEAWTKANHLEYAQQDPTAAAAAYGTIASKATDVASAARALQAQARCLARAGQIDEAIAILLDTLGQERFAHAQDFAGRLIAADAQLRALELLSDQAKPDVAKTAHALAARLNDYDDVFLPAAQRRFLMREVNRLTGSATFPTLEAERLAADYLEAGTAHEESSSRENATPDAGFVWGVEAVFQKDPGKVSTRVGYSNGLSEHQADKASPTRADASLHPSGLPGTWRLASPGGRVVALLKTETVLKRVAEVMAAVALPGDVRVTALLPGMEPDAGVLHSLPAGLQMPGWRLTLALIDAEGSADANGRTAVYVWIAVLLIAAMSIVAVLVAGVLQRQMRVARLKNDLLATVSHELKTPLASMRLLVDTLLDAETLETPRAREYLQLVAKENMRLSHLIDNFLSFSRMERGKRTFELVECLPDEIVRRAAEAAGERFQTPTCHLQVATAADLPPIMADFDALVTAVLNLLDNAYKYSGDQKEIALRTDAQNGQVRFAVSDRGIGLSPRAANKVFRPFYQVDRQLSRSVGGCGLGLSIVTFIATAHGGTVAVDSRPGKGSTFVIALPCSLRGSSE